RSTTYSYDANGSTLSETEAGITTNYHYNAKNKLVAVETGGVTSSFGYNVDGIRTQKTVAGTTTNFVVDSNRDYAQVLAEVENGHVQVSYSYGDDLLSQRRNGQVSYYLYDGHGSTRALSNAAGAVTDSYHYDAFGNLLNSNGGTANSYLYTGEQFDAGLNQYYLRARYYDQNVGRFSAMDSFLGWEEDPTTLHKYIYANVDPVNGTDPSGYFTLGGVMSGVNISSGLSTAST